MKAAPFHYHDPRTATEAVALLGAHEGARVLAGGQSLMPALLARARRAAHLVDLNRITNLPGIEALPDGGLRLGALVRQQEALDSPLVTQRVPLLPLALRHVGHRPVRQRGTVVGSLCQLDPWAELPAATLALEAELEILGPQGSRRAWFAALAQRPGGLALWSGEIVTAVRFPPPRSRQGSGFAEASRRPNDPAMVAVAALLELDADGLVIRAALAVAGLGGLPRRLGEAELVLRGARPSAEAFHAAAEVAAQTEPSPREDALADAAHRRRLARVLTKRALAQALEGVVAP